MRIFPGFDPAPRRIKPSSKAACKTAFTTSGAPFQGTKACIAPVPESGQAPRVIFVQSGTLGEIIPRLGELAQKVARYLQNPTATPPVSAPPPQAGPDDLLDALSELDELRARVGALESEVFEPPAAIPEEDLRNSGGFEPDGAAQDEDE